MNYQIVKLSNGEDIICNVEKNIDGTLQISAPLKMETYNRSTDKGVVESLGLSRWIQPYSDEEKFTIQKNSIVIMTPASSGLTRYYEYVLDNMKNISGELIEPSKKDLKKIEKEESVEMLEDELSEMESILEKIGKTIH
tara:strand:+ start:115 stop:531 length:417 start_codon:yes stop_codon:yes gene_type:complete